MEAMALASGVLGYGYGSEAEMCVSGHQWGAFSCAVATLWALLRAWGLQVVRAMARGPGGQNSWVTEVRTLWTRSFAQSVPGCVDCLMNIVFVVPSRA